MISDPDHPDYRAPAIGQQYWHRPWRQVVTVLGLPGDDDRPDDTVKVELHATGSTAVVKLRSLEE